MVSAPLKQEMDGARPPEPRMRVIWAWAFSEANANMILSMEFAPPLISLRALSEGPAGQYATRYCSSSHWDTGGVRPALPTLSGQILLRHVGT